MPRMVLPAAALSLVLCLTTGVHADSPARTQHAAWQACLNDAFALRAGLSSRSLAADSALRECRDSESAYLTALATSALVDDEDIAHVRPALLARARSGLIGRSQPL